MLPAKERAPELVDLIVKINRLLYLRQWTREDFRDRLNGFLSSNRKLKTNHSGLMQVSRWLDPDSKNWAEPKGEITLALKKFLDYHQ